MQEHRKRAWLISLIALTALPAVLLVHFPTLVSARSLALYFSAIVGYMGLVLLIWMLIIGAKGVMGHIFSDLAPVLSIHKWLGKYGTLAIFTHPLLVTIGYGESLLFSFTPLIDTWPQRHILLGQIAFWVLLLTWILSALVRNILSWRTWKYLHYLAYICVPFVLLHVPELGSQQRSNPFVNAYYMMLVATYAIVMLVRLTSLFNLDRTRYRITRHVKLTPLDYMIQLEPVGIRRLTPRFGQYVYVKLGFISEDHPFSVTQYDDVTGSITVTYRISGMYTKELSGAAVGKTVLLSGPYGTFMQETHDDTTPVVYIAGGIGVTPFVGRILHESDKREQWLFSANRSREVAVLYGPLKKTLSNRAIAIYSTQGGLPVANEERGYITENVLRKYLSEPQAYRYYICGPPVMMDTVRDLLLAMDIKPNQIQSEIFGW